MNFIDKQEPINHLKNQIQVLESNCPLQYRTNGQWRPKYDNEYCFIIESEYRITPVEAYAVIAPNGIIVLSQDYPHCLPPDARIVKLTEAE